MQLLWKTLIALLVGFILGEIFGTDSFFFWSGIAITAFILLPIEK